MKKIFVLAIAMTILCFSGSCFAQQAGVGLSQQMPIHGHSSYADGGNLTMTGEASATSATSPVSLPLGNVTAGDRILVQIVHKYTYGSSTAEIEAVLSTSGTASVRYGSSQIGTQWLTHHNNSGTSAGQTNTASGMTILQVTGSGTLTLSGSHQVFGSGYTLTALELYAYFIKRQ